MEKPTVEQVRMYCTLRGNTVDPEAFWDFYQSKGWVVGKAPMKDWQAAVRTWERGEKKQARKKLRLLPIVGKRCSVVGCGMPAVYKKSGGSYDNFTCTNHLPDNVKEMYE